MIFGATVGCKDSSIDCFADLDENGDAITEKLTAEVDDKHRSQQKRDEQDGQSY